MGRDHIPCASLADAQPRSCQVFSQPLIMLEQSPKFQLRHGLSTAAASAHGIGVVVVKGSLKRLETWLVSCCNVARLHGIGLDSPDEVPTKERLQQCNDRRGGGRESG